MQSNSCKRSSDNSKYRTDLDCSASQVAQNHPRIHQRQEKMANVTSMRSTAGCDREKLPDFTQLIQESDTTLSKLHNITYAAEKGSRPAAQVDSLLRWERRAKLSAVYDMCTNYKVAENWLSVA